MAVIKVENLTKDYGDNRGVFDVSFEVEKGEIFGFLGPNGAGKTTAIRHLMGFSKPQSGKTFIQGMDCWTKQKDIQSNLGYLPGEIAFPDGLTGLQFIKDIADLRGMKDLGRAQEIMDIFQLNAKGGMKRMSKGMKQKVGIVCAFMHTPEVLILDEPTSGLDPLMQRNFIDLILAEKTRGATILLSSHMFNEVEYTCDRVAIIKQGHLMSTVKPEDIRHGQKKTYKVEFNQPKSIEVIKQMNFDVEDTQEDNNQLVFTIDDSEINKFMAEISKHDIKFLSERKSTLEDYFMKYYDNSPENREEV